MRRHDLPELFAGYTFAGHLLIESQLNAKGHAALYRVVHMETGQWLALKVLHPRYGEQEGFRSEFLGGLKVSARVQSDHVVRVYDAQIDGETGMPWITMELLRGRSLADRIADGPLLDHESAWLILAQVGHALAAAHDAGVLPMDLRPEKIFLEERKAATSVGPFVKLLDFGVARVLPDGKTDAPVTGARWGPFWMAPEQMMRDVVRRSTNIWVVGLLAYRILTGRYYWLEAGADSTFDMQRLMDEVAHGELAPPSQRAHAQGVSRALPPGFDEWFARCVNRDRKARFAHAREAFEALREVMTPPSWEVSDPAAAAVWARRAACNLELRCWSDAVSDFSAAIERDPCEGAYWFGRAVALGQLGQHTIARTDLVQAATLGHAQARAQVKDR